MIKENVSDDIEADILHKKSEQLNALVETFSQQMNIETKVLTGTPFLQIIYEVLRNGHDLVIKTPARVEWMDRIFGSDDMHLLRKCPCPVWMISQDTPKSYQNIMAAVDIGSQQDPDDVIKANHALNQQILEMAGSVAVSDLAKLHIVHAWYAYGESLMHSPFVTLSKAQIREYTHETHNIQKKKLDVLLDQVSIDETGKLLGFLKPEKHLIKGFPNKAIPEFAKEIKADLIVMGTIGRTGIPGLIIGNTAEDILNQINCSVLAIKPPGFVSPVTLEK
jgi:nucleotide-binding universal stress UspA family protein